MSRSRSTVGNDAIAVLATAALLALPDAVVPIRPAYAQGGLVCDVGPASYRRCCKESYQRNPELGVAARAADIEACLKSGARGGPVAERRKGDRGDAAERKPGRAAAPDGPPVRPTAPAPHPPPAAQTPRAPPVVRGSGVSPIRRVDCASEPCALGCSADEMAISAFCDVGSFPTLTPKGAVRCTTPGAGTELPIVLFCAKR